MEQVLSKFMDSDSSHHDQYNLLSEASDNEDLYKQQPQLEEAAQEEEVVPVVEH